MESKRNESRENAVVVVKKVIAATREQVFEAWTNPEIMQHWYVGAKGRAKVTVDLRVGVTYTNEMLIEGKASCNNDSHAAGTSYMHQGEYLEIVRPEKLVFTWNSPSVSNTTVTVVLREVADGTEVTITHQLNVLSECPEHTQGWTYALENLSNVLS